MMWFKIDILKLKTQYIFRHIKFWHDTIFTVSFRIKRKIVSDLYLKMNNKNNLHRLYVFREICILNEIDELKKKYKNVKIV